MKLLRIILEKKYGVTPRFHRMHSGVNNYEEFDAVLLIGDEALRHKKTGLRGFDLVYDLATEWYEWQKLPFVFAVWAVKKSMPPDRQAELSSILAASLDKGVEDLGTVSLAHARSLGLTSDESVEYLEGFNYRLGEREKEAIRVFESLLSAIDVEPLHRQ